MFLIEEVRKPHFSTKKSDVGTMENDVICLFTFGSESISAASEQPRKIDFPNASCKVAPGICPTILPIRCIIKFMTVSSGRYAPNKNSGTFVSDFNTIRFSSSRSKFVERDGRCDDDSNVDED